MSCSVILLRVLLVTVGTRDTVHGWELATECRRKSSQPQNFRQVLLWFVAGCDPFDTLMNPFLYNLDALQRIANVR